jgi:hypothetical protein
MNHLSAALGNLAPIERVVAEMFGPHGERAAGKRFVDNLPLTM